VELRKKSKGTKGEEEKTTKKDGRKQIKKKK
jgi:hypothetical protein